MAVAKKKSAAGTQAALKANVTRKQRANRQRFERGEISLGTLRSLNANVTMAARRNGLKG
jgi:hypothetical protein